MGIRKLTDPSTGKWTSVLTHISAVVDADGKTLKKMLEELDVSKIDIDMLANAEIEIIENGDSPSATLQIIDDKVYITLMNIKGDTGDVAVYDSNNLEGLPDFEMASTTGDSTTKAMTQKAVTEALEEVAQYKTTVLTNASSAKNKIITTSDGSVPYGQWKDTSSTNTCIFYPAIPGKKYRVTLHNDTNSCHFIFMTSNTAGSDGSTPAYAGEPIEMPAWTSTPVTIVTAPPDAAYIYVRYKLTGNVIAPTIEMIDYIDEKIDELETSIATLETNLTDTVASINSHFKIKDTRWEGTSFLQWVSGTIYGNDDNHLPGTLTSSSNYKRASFRNDGYSRVVYYAKAQSNFAQMAFYTTNTYNAANCIGYVNGNGSMKKIDRALPEGTEYVVITCSNADFDNSYLELYAENLKPVAKTQSDVAAIDGAIKNVMFVTDQTQHTGKLGSLNSNGTHATNNNYTVWDVPCYEYSHIDARLRAPSSYKVIAFYSSAKPSASTMIGSVAGNSSITNYSADVPSGCKCISICTDNDVLSSSWFKIYAPNVGSAITAAKENAGNGDADFYLGRVNDVVSLNDPVGMPHKLTQMKGSGKLMLLHCSDIHYSSSSSYKGKDNYFRILQWWRQYYSYFDDAIATGDLVWNQFSHDFTFWNAKDDENWTNPMLLTLGNHDTSNSGNDYGSSGNYTGGTPNDDIYNKFFSQNITNWNLPEGGHTGTNLYYYKDYSKSRYETDNEGVIVDGIRLIALNPYNYTEEIKNNQLQWFEDVLSDAKTKKLAVIIAQHVTFRGYNDSTTGERHAINCTFSAVGSEEKDDVQGGLIREFALKVENFIKAGGHFICWLAGHHHRDSVYKYRYSLNNDESPWQLQVSIGAATSQQSSGNSDLRIDGMKSQDLFNIISVSTTRNLLTIVRIGQDYDAFLRHKGTLVINYKTMEVIQNL